MRSSSDGCNSDMLSRRCLAPVGDGLLLVLMSDRARERPGGGGDIVAGCGLVIKLRFMRLEGGGGRRAEPN